MFKKSLGRNSLGVDRIFNYDPEQKRTWIEYHQDVQPILDHSKRIKNDPDVWKKGVLLFRLLNSRDYGYLKCTDKIHIPKGAKTA
jgi:hypothetical protein